MRKIWMELLRRIFDFRERRFEEREAGEVIGYVTPGEKLER